MVRYATPLDGRDPKKPEIRPDEAIEMFELGFNFSLYGERGEYRLSVPYQIARETGSDRITFLQ